MKKPSIAIIHYSCYPVIGGVESVIDSHAKLLTENGYPVTIISGKGEKTRKDVPVHRIDELRTDHPAYTSAMKQVKTDTTAFDKAVQSIRTRLHKALKGIDVCIAHNVMTMHFNLGIAWAIKEIADSGKGPRFINWIHDCTLNDPTYTDICPPDQYPWSILGMKQKMKYVVISEQRREQVSRLFGISQRSLTVIPNGIDMASFLKLTPTVDRIFHKERLDKYDIVALTPTRIVARKNLELGLDVLREIKASGVAAKWLITGAPDPHNPAVITYFKWLKKKITEYKLTKDVVFLSHKYKTSLSSEDVSSLFQVSNVLFFLSKQEGFGIPLIEAGMAKLHILASNIPPLKAAGGSNVTYVPLGGKDIRRPVKKLITEVSRSPVSTMNKRVQREYPWELIFKKKIEPLIKKAGRK